MADFSPLSTPISLLVDMPTFDVGAVFGKSVAALKDELKSQHARLISKKVGPTGRPVPIFAIGNVRFSVEQFRGGAVVARLPKTGPYEDADVAALTDKIVEGGDGGVGANLPGYSRRLAAQFKDYIQTLKHLESFTGIPRSRIHFEYGQSDPKKFLISGLSPEAAFKWATTKLGPVRFVRSKKKGLNPSQMITVGCVVELQNGFVSVAKNAYGNDIIVYFYTRDAVDRGLKEGAFFPV